MERFVLTNRKCYTPEEIVNYFSEYVKPENVRILIDHIGHPDLAESIFSFTEQNGVLFLTLGDGSDPFAVTYNK